MNIPKKLMATVLAIVACAVGADFPEKPVTLVVPFAAGGPRDKIARDLAEASRKPLVPTVIIENLGGAGGTIGAARVARVNPEGYTLLVHHIGLVTAPALYRKLRYNTPGYFEYLGLINEASSTRIGRPGLPANNSALLRKWIGDNEGKINITNAGVGSASHLYGLMLQNALKTNMTTVSYKGTAPAMTDLMGGQVDLMCEQATDAVPQIQGAQGQGLRRHQPAAPEAAGAGGSAHAGRVRSHQFQRHGVARPVSATHCAAGGAGQTQCGVARGAERPRTDQA